MSAVSTNAATLQSAVIAFYQESAHLIMENEKEETVSEHRMDPNDKCNKCIILGCFPFAMCGLFCCNELSCGAMTGGPEHTMTASCFKFVFGCGCCSMLSACCHKKSEEEQAAAERDREAKHSILNDLKKLYC